jgi:hypothetical protein
LEEMAELSSRLAQLEEGERSNSVCHHASICVATDTNRSLSTGARGSAQEPSVVPRSRPFGHEVGIGATKIVSYRLVSCSRLSDPSVISPKQSELESSWHSYAGRRCASTLLALRSLKYRFSQRFACSIRARRKSCHARRYLGLYARPAVQ